MSGPRKEPRRAFAEPRRTSESPRQRAQEPLDSAVLRLLPKWVELGRAVCHFDAQAVGIEDEHLVEARDVLVLLGREVDAHAHVEGSAVGGVDVLALLDIEGKVLHPDVVVAVLAAVGLAETEVLVAEREVDDLLGAAVGGEPPRLPHPERTEQPQIKSERALDVTHREIDVVDRDAHRAPLSNAECRTWGG